MLALAIAASGLPALASDLCPAEQAEDLLPKDPALCAALDPVVRRPRALPLYEYQAKLGDYLRNFCHRRTDAGWKPDKFIRDTGPFTAEFEKGAWSGRYHGTHAPVVIWYSPEAYAWVRQNRPADERARPEKPAAIPDGAILVKEMYPAPAARCRGIALTKLLPTSGAAVMIRDAGASYDGWFWGWFGWSGWDPDWPPGEANGYPNLGFGQYCTNCHASARDNATFADAKNIAGEPGQPLVFLSQHWFLQQSAQAKVDFAPVSKPAEPLSPTAEAEKQDGEEDEDTHLAIALEADDVTRVGAEALNAYDAAFVALARGLDLPRSPGEVKHLPSETYDNVWVAPGGPTHHSTFLTSDQCVGCHSAGGTGLQLDMTEPAADGKLLNVSPYGTWRTSPMGLAGRDPVFFAQLASETETFHPDASSVVENTCLGCHAFGGHRQFRVDQHAATGACQPASREMMQAAPFPPDDPLAGLAKYGALARDGITCTACHRMLVSAADMEKHKDDPQNACIQERQELLNPQNTGFARTFTGSFLVGPPDEIYGPFENPKQQPMLNALGLKPVQKADIRSSELCGACHTVHLPVRHGGETIRHTYEQVTYPEWAFSAYRTGTTPDGALPFGPGATPRTCQDCHMPNRDGAGRPYRSKIASIQEYSNFPQAENTLPPEDIDLPVREGFAKHTLVGLNVFLLKMAQQFPQIFGIRTQDPMLVGKGVSPLQLTESAILHQARNDTASIGVGAITREHGRLIVPVTVENKAGHKFPSGVGFRRAFLEFRVLDASGRTLWASGRTDRAGVIVDEKGSPVAGEKWWTEDCSARIDPLAHQPHFQTVSRQDQAQIYQELVSAPPKGQSGEAPRCGPGAPPSGALTTSFLSICATVKDNRLLPHGYLPLEQRAAIAKAIGAGEELAEEAGAVEVGGDPDYVDGGGDTVTYSIDVAELASEPASVQASLYYQATPPFYLQDRFCTSKSEETKRLAFVTGRLNLAGTRAANWKLLTVSTGPVAVPR